MKTVHIAIILCQLFLANAVCTIASEVKPIADTPFYQDYHEGYPLSTPAENDVKAITIDKAGKVWAATKAGVRTLEGGKWTTPSGSADIGRTNTIYCDSDGIVWIGAWNGLYKVVKDKLTPTELHDMPIAAIRGMRYDDGKGETVYVAGPKGIWRSKNGSWDKIPGKWQTNIRAIQPTTDKLLWIATASGLYKVDLLPTPPTTILLSKPKDILSSNVYSIFQMPQGYLFIGSSGGVDFYLFRQRRMSATAMGTNIYYDKKTIATSYGKMPSALAGALNYDENNRLWVATKLGVVRSEDDPYTVNTMKWVMRHSKRWLQSDEVRDIAIGKDGTAWIATAAGVDAIRRKKMTLAEKSDYYLDVLLKRHIRTPGLVGPAVLVTPGDVSQSFIEDDDNDGEHTAMFLACESMRYAVTKDPVAREHAKTAFHALMLLQTVTGTPHFIARSVLPIGTAPRHEVDRSFTPEELAEMAATDPRSKAIEKRWIPSADGKWLWKRDASSDEVDGHMFGYSTYYDLAADADEKKLVADQVDRIVGGIIDHGFVLQDIDGKGTQWGNWSPESLNGDPNWREEKPGNSVEIMAYLGTAFHMTGKARYREAAEMLIRKHGYDKNMLLTKADTPSEQTHIEDELLSMVYPTLLSHLVLPSLKETSLKSMDLWHETAGLDGIPFYDFPYVHYSGKKFPLARAVETLREWPLDQIEWSVDNSQRADIEWDRTPGREEGLMKRILSRSEMGLQMWDGQPFRATIGNEGRREEKGTDWLLAYWMGRYYGLLAGK